MHLEPPQVFRYKIDSGDRIRFVDTAWKDFARNQGVPELGEKVIGTRLWQHIYSQEIVHIYQTILKKIRSSRGEMELRFPFRCDSPTMERHMEMRVHQCGKDEIEFQSTLLRESPRTFISVFDPEAEKAHGHIVMCAWCNKIKNATQWVSLEEGIRDLAVFQKERPPRISHGICPGCAATMMQGWQESRPDRLDG